MLPSLRCTVKGTGRILASRVLYSSSSTLSEGANNQHTHTKLFKSVLQLTRSDKSLPPTQKPVRKRQQHHEPKDRSTPIQTLSIHRQLRREWQEDASVYAPDYRVYIHDYAPLAHPKRPVGDWLTS